MKKTLILLFILIIFSSVFSQEKRLALIIGNEEYPLGALNNPVNDADSIAANLSSVGFEIIQYENLDQKMMARVIDNFGNKLKDYDVGLFFYAGHGIQSKGLNYLIPVDAVLNTESDIDYNCVRADRILGKMEDAGSKVNIVILDACRDNPFERSWKRDARGRGLATMSAPVGSLIAYATSPGSVAYDGTPGENGLFTSALIKYIREPGITAIQVFQKVTAHVYKNTSGKQLPWVSTSLTGDIFLVPGSAKNDYSQYITDAENEAVNEYDAVKGGKEISLAILPFKNLTGKPEQDYLVHGQHYALYTELCRLSQVKPLRIVGGRTVEVICNDDMSVPDIAKKVNVDYLVEASVFSFEDSVILQVRMIKAYPEERPVFATTYMSDVRNIYKLHSNIAGQLVDKLQIGLTPENISKLPSSREVNPESYKAYLRGLYHIHRLTNEGIEKGLEYLHEAVEIDPADPYAYLALARGYLDIAHSPYDNGEMLLKAEAAANRAVELDSTMAETYAVLAELYSYSLWKFDLSEKYFKKALELNPNMAFTHYHYSWLLYLLGRNEEAITEHKLAQKYDPLEPLHTAWLGGLYCFIGRYEDAICEAEKSFELQKDYIIAYYVLGEAYLKMGENEKAIKAHKKLVELYPLWKWQLGCTYAFSGFRDEAEEILKDLEQSDVNPWTAFGRAKLYTALGNKDEAFKWLNYEPHHAWLAWVAVFNDFESLHSDPRFDEFLKKLNLPK